MESKRNSKVKRIVSVVLVIFFILSLALLLFATLSLRNDRMSLFGYRFYYVTTPSMEPDIMAGSFIISKQVLAEELKVGDIISFVSRDPDIKGMINTHNIHAINKNDNGILEFTTKGTNNRVPDDYLVYAEDIKGRVVFDSLLIGKLFKILSNRWVSFCLTVLPIAVIVLINFIDLVKVINFFPDDEKGNNKKSD